MWCVVQVDKIRDERPQVLIGTPGRVAELVLDKKKIRLSKAAMVVLDEVDLLLDSSYIGDVRMLLSAMGSLEQVVFASATGDRPQVRAFADELMRPGYPVITSQGVTDEDGAGGAIELPKSLRHGLYICPANKAPDALRRLMYTEPRPTTVLAFVNDADKVSNVGAGWIRKADGHASG
jgi:superfamily II DNA/RNA helicase